MTRTSAGALALLASAAVATVGIVFLALMFGAFAAGAQAAGTAFGWVNDLCVLAQFVLMVPAVLAVRTALRPVSPRLAAIGTPIALVGIAAMTVFQGLLVAGVMTFDAEVGFAMMAFALIAAWLVACGVAGGRTRVVPFGLGLAIAASLYVGFPAWAWRVGRWMQAGDAPATGGIPPIRAAVPDLEGER